MYRTDQTTIDEINKVIEAYFAANPSLTIVPVKALMPSFIRAGIFAKDRKNGAPIRSILKELDQYNRLEMMPLVYPERHDDDTYWYFMPADAPRPTTPYKQEEKKAGSKNDAPLSSDKNYVIELCDQVIGMKANRTKRFDFLLGDLHKDGVSQTKLPVDAYYAMLHLVVQYNGMKPWEATIPERKEREESQDSEDPDELDANDVAENDEDTPEIRVKRKVTREEQRTIYEERRARVFPKHDIDYVLISYSNFKHDEELKIIRDEAADLKIVHQALKEFISPEEEASELPK
ncbi:MAG: hypothetical protein ACERKD_03105 [Prolixibacteraceae bacterium]